MGLMLGIDTGGTYTDAVLFDKKNGIKNAAKALTTKHDLTIGITKACEAVLQGVNTDEITMVSLSSTLATNAIVEKHSNPVCLIMIGFDESVLQKANLKSALDNDPCYFVAGGHKASGEMAQQLDEQKIKQIINTHKDSVTAFAVCSVFAVRNNQHELRTQQLIAETCNLPTTLSHSLADALDAPRRGLTALLNARLISQIVELINSVKAFLTTKNISANLMIVQGNGSLMSADMAIQKPVETIMSGPAASLIGAAYLTQQQDVIVSDIGGTTTDIAVIKDGLPALNPNGATVHGWRTMVEAVAVYTVGLGGDSEVRAENGNLILGPRRVTPLSLLATEFPYIIDILTEQLNRDYRRCYDGIFAHRLRNINHNITALSASEKYFWDALKNGAKSLEQLLQSGRPPKPLERLVDKGLVIYSAFATADASHILGLQDQWDKTASVLGGKIYALKQRRPEHDWATDEIEFSQMVINQMTLQSSKVIIASSYLNETGIDLLQESQQVDKFLHKLLTDDNNNDFSLAVKFNKPLIAIGAPAQTYYQPIAKKLGAELIIPQYAYAANAVGAVVGKIGKTIDITISAPSDGIYRVHADTNKTFNDLDKAVKYASDYGINFVSNYIEKNYGFDIITNVNRQDSVVKIANKDMFIESLITVHGVGKPIQKG